jgi:DNA-binding transcriptional regulator YiaG
MATKKVKQPTMLDVAHEMAKDLYEATVIDAAKMREFDAQCSTIVKDNP